MVPNGFGATDAGAARGRARDTQGTEAASVTPAARANAHVSLSVTGTNPVDFGVTEANSADVETRTCCDASSCHD
jgi:hypothetical protein